MTRTSWQRNSLRHRRIARREAIAMSGPLEGVRVVEFAGIGPAPFCVMLLADLGADVLRIERAVEPAHDPVTARGRTSLALDLKTENDIALALAALERADVLVEGF